MWVISLLQKVARELLATTELAKCYNGAVLLW